MENMIILEPQNMVSEIVDTVKNDFEIFRYHFLQF